jgi:hypothetical protein
MKQRRRIYYSTAQRSEIWDRWQAGEPMSSIGRRFDRPSFRWGRLAIVTNVAVGCGVRGCA